MEFDINAFKKLIQEMQKPSVIAFCPPAIVDDLKERWDETIAKVDFRPMPYSTSDLPDTGDKIYLFPTETVKEVFKIKIQEE